MSTERVNTLGVNHSMWNVCSEQSAQECYLIQTNVTKYVVVFIFLIIVIYCKIS